VSAFEALAAEPRWVAWRNEQRKDKKTKIPYAPAGGMAKADDPSTWGPRMAAEQRQKRISNGLGGGIGIELGDLGGDTYICGIDLDSCLDCDKLAPWAAAILKAAPSYAEISPSGTGIKLFFYMANEDVRPFLNLIGVDHDKWGCRRDAPGADGRDHGPAIEIYCSHRYFAVTERPWPGMPSTLQSLDSVRLEQLARLLPPRAVARPGGNGDNSRSALAMRKGLALRRTGKNYDQMVAALKADPETADWCREKGDAAGGREFKRIWEKAGDVIAKDKATSHSFVLQKIEWVWPGWLAAGKLHLIAGAKGAGKSTIVFDLAARLTSGSQWPDGKPAPQADVIIWSGEDDIEDTILPRFVAAGGNLDKIIPIKYTIDGGSRRPFDPSTDIPALVGAAEDLPDLRLVFIDPVVLVLPDKSDSHKNTETRRGLQPLVEFAEHRHVALIGATHFTKGTGGRDPIERVTGSLAFGALPRIVWGASADGDGFQRRLVRIASNISPSGGGFEYTLFQAPLVERDFFAQRVAWGAKLNGSPRELLNAEKQSAEAKAARFLREFLDVGPKLQREIKVAADAHGHAWATVRRAKEKLGIKPVKDEVKDGAWSWELPREDEHLAPRRDPNEHLQS
jgi:hypothetical protein